ncbi:hypothetical protein FH609_027180 [Streptomyces sp. 3MP-14]|uniref:Uncharacterized protein n=1 Tax=Streptomyces mimosae TaxID=2586635 RepID=A0A5N6A227_9ACTN|nr:MULTISPECIES: hypothetical protein [Streptomyces]KAB8161388.1 hypothetical protein FH607_025215 [Streptomyces mimosae]KAB8173288.1 hypothetical protein FH609_027180 [Streptomyces sp. 3MP-14]
MGVRTGDGDWLGRLRPINDYLVALDRQHYERSGAAPLLLALVAVPVAACAVLVGVAVPLSDVSAYAGWLLPGVPVAAGLAWLAWLAVRRLTPRHGPLGAEFRAGEEQRDAVLRQLYALPPLGPAHGEALWRGADELYHRSTERLTAFRPRDQRELVHGMRTAPFVRFRWTLAGWAVGILTVVGTVATLAPVFAEPGDWWPMAVTAATLAVGWSLCFRYCFLKWREPADRVPRVRKVGWRHELAWLRHQLAISGVLAGWRIPALHTERLWRLTGGGRRSPAATLARLPEDASPLRRFYWRYVGAGVVRLVAFFGGCYLVATAISLAR